MYTRHSWDGDGVENAVVVMDAVAQDDTEGDWDCEWEPLTDGDADNVGE